MGDACSQPLLENSSWAGRQEAEEKRKRRAKKKKEERGEKRNLHTHAFPVIHLEKDPQWTWLENIGLCREK